MEGINKSTVRILKVLSQFALSKRTYGLTDLSNELGITKNMAFRALTTQEIAYYVRVHRPLDKAGAYGVQDWIGYTAVERIEGSFYTVMGLPMHRVYSELSKLV